MKTPVRPILTVGLFSLLMSSCQSTGSGSASDTHDMGGLRAPRMNNSIMPAKR